MKTTQFHRLRLSLMLGLLAFVVLALTGCLGGRTGAPRAIFTASALEGETPFPVLFNGSLSVDPDRDIILYKWDFGDNNEGTGVLVTHHFKENGTFTVSLTVTDSRGISNSSSIVVHALNPAPTATFSYSPKTMMEGEYVVSVYEWLDFDASGSTDDEEIVTYDWDFGDGTTVSSDSPNARHRFMEPGNYQVVITVTDNEGETARYIEWIRVEGVRSSC